VFYSSASNISFESYRLLPFTTQSSFVKDRMRFTSSVALTLLAGTLSNALPAPQEAATSTIPASALPTAASQDTATATEQIDQLALFAAQQANATLTNNGAKRGSCNINNVAVRREWGALSNPERKAYTDAVLCLQKKTTKTPAALIPGARSRFDDWVGTHVNQTQTIHYTGTVAFLFQFLHYHVMRVLRFAPNAHGTFR
jgi:tyrosinase